MRTSLVLPTFNEAENLRDLAAQARAALPAATVWVVDDDSPDGTGAIAEELAAADPGIRVLRRTGGRGYGTALTEGIGRALAEGAEAVLTMDCDFSHDPGDLPRLLAALSEADVAIGSRYVRGGEIRDWSWVRRLLSFCANLFVRALFHLPARDCTSGFRAYRRAALENLPWPQLHSEGYSFLVEVLYWVTRTPGVRVREAPIRFVDRTRGTSKMGPREIVRGAANLLRARLQRPDARAGAPALSD